MARSVIIDCDPGVDDCFALMTALGSPDEIDLKAICVVAGNVPVETCFRNARGLLALAGREDVPVYAGCERPLAVEPEFADFVHGASGLGDAVLPEPAAPPQDQHAVDYLCEALGRADPGSITLVITGPATNFATVLQRDPGLAEAVGELIVMGGANREGGNITPHAEFNIYADPEAAAIALACGRPITLIGLDATLQFRCTPDRMARLESSPGACAAAGTEMIRHVNRVYGEIYGAEGSAMHDPCTILYLLAPDRFSGSRALVDVVTGSGERRGHTAIRPASGDEGDGTVLWVTGLTADPLFDLLMERMERLK